MLPLTAGPQNMLGGITRSTVDPPKRGTLMTGELALMLADLVKALGGEKGTT